MANYFNDVGMVLECICTNESDAITDGDMSCLIGDTVALFAPVSISSDDRHDDGIVLLVTKDNNSDKIDDRLWEDYHHLSFSLAACLLLAAC